MRLFQLGFLYRLLGGIDLENPITLHELKRLPTYRMGRWSLPFDILGGIEFIFTLPGFWVPFVHWLWRIPALLNSAVLISHELEDQTWNTFRATTLSVREIVLAKYAAVIRLMEPHFTLVTSIRALPVLVFGLSWAASTLTVLPKEGFGYWFSTSCAFLASGISLLLSPALDIAFDTALGLLASVFSSHRAASLILAFVLRGALFLLPVALLVPLQTGALAGLSPATMIQFRAVSIVATFGPAYAFLWGLDPWPSVLLVIIWMGLKIGITRLMIEFVIRRAGRMEA